MSLSVSYSGDMVNFWRCCATSSGAQDCSNYYEYYSTATCSYSSTLLSDNSYDVTINSITGTLSSVDHGYYSCANNYDGQCKNNCCTSTTISLANNLSGSMSSVASFDFHRYGGLRGGPWTRNVGQSFTLAPGESRTFTIGKGTACTTRTRTVTFRNTNTKPQPTPPSVSARATCSSSSYNSASFSASVSWGYCESGYSSSSYSITDANGNVIKSGSGTSVSLGTLQANTQYSVTFNVNNGCYSRSSSASVVTSTGNSITDITPTSYDTASVRIVPIMGGNYYKTPTHTIQVAKVGTSTWKTVATSNATSPTVVTFNGLTEETAYQIRCITTNGGGCSYTSTGSNFTTPPKGICIVDFTSIEPDTDNRCQNTWVDVCCKWVTYLTPADIEVYYRVKDGYDDTWLLADKRTVNGDEGTYCFRINEIFPNQVVYEMYVHTHTEQVDWNSDLTEFTSPLCPEVTSDNCTSLTYMTEYLCASIKKIVDGGNMKVFANPYSLQLCEPGNESPTNLTLWTRYLRLAHAYLCILCDFMNLSHATEGQYLVGEIGWTNILTEIVESEMGTDGWKLATSDAIYKYLHEKLKSVWHYQGTVDVLVTNLADLGNYPTATSAIVMSEDAIYNKSGGEWVKSTEIVPEDFGVFHINYESDVAKAESGWYYWGGTWNNLDADLEDLEAQIEEIETKSNVLVQNAPGEQKSIMLVDKNYTFADTPIDKNIVYFLTESQTLPTPIYYTVTFAESDGTVLRTEQVISGGVMGVYTPVKEGHTFNGWETVDGEPFDDTMPVLSDITIYASWSAIELVVDFNIGDAVGETPGSQTVEYGETITLPGQENFELDGKNFGGWDYMGVTWSNSMPVLDNMTLNAIWDSVMITVAIRTQPDQPDQILQVEWGTTLTPLPEPERTGYTFTGWFTESGEEFDFTTPITENTVIVAGWVVSEVTVTFNAQTLPPNAEETVENPAPVTIARGSTVAEPVVTAENWVIDYWTLNGLRYNFDTPVTENITLDAVWGEAVEVVFDANGGEPTPAPQRVPQGGYAKKPEDPVKEDCDFIGWSAEPIYTVTFSTQVPGQDWTVQVANGDTISEPTYQPTRNGYVFKGWAVDGAAYDWNTPVTSDLTINAVWNPLYTVTFDPGYDGAQITTVQVENGQTVQQPTDPTNPDTNCTFEGWKEENV